jgi:2-polyprenyl-3-methyl-5-hydroxy-6-metoxy-1,4-benzoquinol methylase
MDEQAKGPEGVGDGRFEFGANWQRFLSVLDDDRIAAGEQDLRQMLGQDSLSGCTVLDIGSGSGLSSLSALRLGAASVHSFDYDPLSVACTAELRRRYRPDDPTWKVERGDAVDVGYVRGLGQFDIVYSWGVLHHTGNMWTALENAAAAVAPGGRFFIAIYNDQGLRSRIWRSIKRTYCRIPAPLQAPFALAVMLPRELLSAAASTARLKPQEYVHSWTRYSVNRGMSRWHDLIDWVGGYPFEVATPDEIFDFGRDRGFVLESLRTTQGGLGCNQFVFRRLDAPA